MKIIWSEHIVKEGIPYIFVQKYQYSDGGRSQAGFKGETGDCVVRSIAIALEIPYKQVYDEINQLCKDMSKGKSKYVNKFGSSREGVNKKVYTRYLAQHNWIWVPLMKIGSGCTTHVRGDELPKGRLILALSKHMSCMVDGVLYDTYDCSRNGTRCVYGYFKKL